MERVLPMLKVVAAAVGLIFSLLFMLQLTTSVAHAGVLTPQRQGTIPIATAILTPTKDNTLYESTAGEVSNGAGAYFFVGNTGGSSARRGLLAFDLADKLPAGATILSATLQLHMSRTSGGPVAIGLHRATAAWGEGTSSAAGNQGQGAAATAGDATWLHAFHDTTFWQTPGGDFVPTATVTTTVNDTGFYTWTSPALVSELQQWLADSTTNHGWVLLGEEDASSTTKRFATRENNMAAHRPQLTILYQGISSGQISIYLPIVQNE